MPGILFVAPGPDAERAVFGGNRRGLWSAALPVVLEKHGYLALELAGAEVLSDPDRLAGYDVVLVARGPADPWRGGILQAARDRGASLILDGPPTPAAREQLGLAEATPAAGVGTVHIRDATLRAAAARFGTPVGGRVAMPEDVRGDDARGQDASPVAGVPITDLQAEAWSARPWEAEAWAGAAGGTVLMSWLSVDGAQATPAVVRWGPVVACSFGLFAFLSYAHTAAPLAPGHRQQAHRTVGLEIALLGIIDLLHRERGAVRARVRPWPRGVRWVVAMRHDVARGAGDEVARAIAADSSRATWACSADGAGEVARAAAAAGHEVGLLATRLWEAPSGREVVALARAAGGPVVRGAVTSTARGAFGFRGAPNVLWAAREGLLYTELLGRGHLHPHRFPALAPDGRIETLRPLCVPWYENLEPLTSDPARLADTVELFSAAGGLLQVRADPGPRLASQIAQLLAADLRGAARWTIAEAAEWWLRSHDRSRMGLSPLGDGRFAVRAAETVEGLVVELLHPDGSVSEHAIDAGPDELIVGVEEVRQQVFPLTWQETWRSFARALAPAVGDTPGGSIEIAPRLGRATASTIAAHGELVLGLLSDFGGHGDLTGSVVLDLGSGVGATSCYLAWRAAPELVLAVDDDAVLLRAARDTVTRLGFDRRVRTMLAETSNLSELPDASVDVAVLAGTPVPARGGELRRAAAELQRVLVPGGAVVIHDRNRRRRTALSVRRALMRTGMTDLRSIGYGPGERHLSGWRRHFDPRFAIVARRTGEPSGRSSLPPGSPTPGAGAAAVEFTEQIAAVLAHHVRADLRARGVRENVVARTVRINSTLAEQRSRRLLALLRDEFGILTLEGRRVLELGAGFGAVAAHLAVLGQPAAIIAAESNPRLVGVARVCIDELGLVPTVEVRSLESDSLDGIASASIEVVLADRGYVRAGTLAEIERVLVRGGAVLVYGRRALGLRYALRRVGLEPVWRTRRLGLARGRPLAARKPA